MYFEAFYSVDDSQAVNTLDYCPTQLFTVVEIFIRLSLEVKVFNLFILQQWRLTILIIRGKINYCRRKFCNFDTDSIRILLMRFYLFFSRSCFSSLIISVLIGYFNSGPHVEIFFLGLSLNFYFGATSFHQLVVSPNTNYPNETVT